MDKTSEWIGKYGTLRRRKGNYFLLAKFLEIDLVKLQKYSRNEHTYIQTFMSLNINKYFTYLLVILWKGFPILLFAFFSSTFLVSFCYHLEGLLSDTRYNIDFVVENVVIFIKLTMYLP